MGNYEFSLLENVFKYEFDDVSDLNKEREKDGKRPMPPTLKRLECLGIMDDFDKEDRSADQTLKPWARICNHVDFLNREGKDGAKHKVVFLLRHGYSLHNYIEKGAVKTVAGRVVKDNWRKDLKVAYKKYVSLGTLENAFREAGNRFSSSLAKHLGIEGANPTVTISLLDAPLLLLPKEIVEELRDLDVKNNDVRELREEWLTWVEKDKLPWPGTIYTSPLDRCRSTTKVVFGKDHNSQPVIKEDLREKRNGDACNYRAYISSTAAKDQGFVLEPDFAEEDPYKNDIKHAEKGKTTESEEQLEERMRRLLSGIFDDDEESVVSLTTHSYSIGALTKVMQCNYRLDEGDVAAFLVRAVPV
ncbi:hypothetical protein PG994_005142 [Apiospora phragmitis]|uniref:Phosphoglycerate mutase n=1 Tax=Apiospora phragmitis TaxID=2905665 RepID=A0ABR1VSM9_9PEZI